MEPEFIDEERIPLLERDEINGDDSIYEDSQVETSFFQEEDEQQQQKLDVEINALERGFNVKIPPEERGREDIWRILMQSRTHAYEIARATENFPRD